MQDLCPVYRTVDPKVLSYRRVGGWPLMDIKGRSRTQRLDVICNSKVSPIRARLLSAQVNRSIHLAEGVTTFNPSNKRHTLELLRHQKDRSVKRAHLQFFQKCRQTESFSLEPTASCTSRDVLKCFCLPNNLFSVARISFLSS